MAVNVCISQATIAVTNRSAAPQQSHRNISVITNNSTPGGVYVNKERSPDGKLSYNDHLKVVENLNEALMRLHAQRRAAKAHEHAPSRAQNSLRDVTNAPQMRYSFENKGHSTDDVRGLDRVVPHTHAQMMDFVRREQVKRMPHTVSVAKGAPRAKTVRGLHVDGNAPKNPSKHFVTSSVTQLFKTSHLKHPLSKPLGATFSQQKSNSALSLTTTSQTSTISSKCHATKKRSGRRRAKTSVTRSRSVPRPHSAHFATGAEPLSALAPGVLTQKPLHPRISSPAPSLKSSVVSSETASVAAEMGSTVATESPGLAFELGRDVTRVASDSNEDMSGNIDQNTSPPVHGLDDDEASSEVDEQITVCSSANHVKIETRKEAADRIKDQVQLVESKRQNVESHAYVNANDGLPPLPQVPSFVDEDRVYFSAQAHQVLSYYVDQEQNLHSSDNSHLESDNGRHARCVVSRSTSAPGRTRSTAPPPSPSGSTQRLDKIGRIHTPTPVRIISSRTSTPPRRPASDAQRTRTPEPAVDQRIYSYVKFHRPLGMLQSESHNGNVNAKQPTVNNGAGRASRSRSRHVLPCTQTDARFQIYGTSYTHFNQPYS